LRLPIKQCELARLLSVTPVYLSMMLRRLAEDGMLEARKGWIIIPDLAIFLQRLKS